jgi:four helix bundle protein
MKSYKDLEVYNLGLELFYIVHEKSFKLSKYELYELGSQVRRSSDSALTNVLEWYGRKRYKADFIKFLMYSWASCLETVFHIEKINRLCPDVFLDDLDVVNQ